MEYYTDETDVRRMRADAQTVGPAFFKLADANDLQVVVVKASRGCRRLNGGTFCQGLSGAVA